MFALIVIIMGVGGPIGVVRQWLEKFAVWIALATGVWLTVHAFSTMDVAALLRQPGDGSLPFGSGADLAIALPISWLPLVADYNRFSRSTRQGFLGTMLGFFITNAWFLSLGACLLLGSKVGQEPKDFASAIALSAGWIALLILLADETHNAWADLYSAAVSLQNLFPKVKQRWLIVGTRRGMFPGGRFPGHHPVPELPLPHRVILRAPVRPAHRGLLCAEEKGIPGGGVLPRQGGVLVHAGRERTGDDCMGRRHCRLPSCQPFDPWGDIPRVAESWCLLPSGWRAGHCRALRWPSCSPSCSDSRRDPAGKDVEDLK